jgi:predicted amidohydrolase YtcJ
MQSPDLIILNASVLTQVSDRPRAHAVAVSGNKISHVGDSADIAKLAGASTRIIDANGATLLPGFVEAHMHLFGGGAGLKLLQLFGVEGVETLGKLLRSYAAQNPDEGLLIAKGADYTILGDQGPVTRHQLDAIIPDRPLILIAPDHHTAWANTSALKKAGIFEGRDVGPGNEIVMGADGHATGELREGHAMAPVMALRTSGGRDALGLTGTEPEPGLSDAARQDDIETLKAGLRACAATGITQIHNMDGNWYQLELLAEIEAAGDLICRVEVPFHLTNDKPLSSLAEASAMAEKYQSDKLYSNRIKVFVDGVLDSGTAVLVEDYADQPGWRGEPLFTPQAFIDAAIEADRRGLQISVHAIGDGAVRMVLDGYAAARAANGVRDSRHRIEHIELVHPDDIPRFAELGVIASMQPPHPPGNAGLPLEPTLSKIGAARWQYAYAWRTLWNSGARLVFASDWPVSPLEPLLGIQEAVRRPLWRYDLPDQSATLQEAIAGYTIDGAYAGFRERDTGQLAPGYLADLVLLDGDIEAMPVDQIAGMKPVLTICDGEITYEAGP